MTTIQEFQIYAQASVLLRHRLHALMVILSGVGSESARLEGSSGVLQYMPYAECVAI